jgi:tripartite-type tricarboxylate transporter receptor subunit TctC
MIVSALRRAEPKPSGTRAALNHLRRRRLVGTSLAATAWPHLAPGQASWPQRPVRVLFGFPAGSTPDAILRLLAGTLGEQLGQPVLVDNRTGAAGAIAAEAAARAPADGHTLLLLPHSTLVLPLVRRDLGFDPMADFVPVAGMASAPLILVVAPQLGVRDLDGFLALARARGDALAYGMSGVGASPHLAMTRLAREAGITPTAVTFRGDPEIFTALLSGQVQAAFVLAPTAVPLVREGKLLGLGVTAPRRLPLLPELPTIAEAGQPAVELASWWGLVAPRGTSPEIVRRLAAAMEPALAAPLLQARLGAVGAEALTLGPEAFGRFMHSERARLADLYETLGLVVR